MDTLIIFISLINGYYFAIKGIFEKESKEKIFYIIFMTIIFILIMMILRMVGLGIINIVLYVIFLFLVHSFYTDFIIIKKLDEYFLKNSKEEEFSIRIIVIRLMIKELTIMKKEVYSLIGKNEFIFDIIILTLSFIFSIILLLHIGEFIDIFVIIYKIFYN